MFTIDVDLRMTVATHKRARWLGTHILIHEPELRAWLRRHEVVGIEIDDIVQEAYAILATLESVDHIYNPRVYFFQVAKSVIQQSLRRSKVVPFGALADLDALTLQDEAPSPERIAQGRQELSRLSRLIDELPPKRRQAFVLRKIRGLSQRQTASEMGVSENTVEKHIGKALEFLSKAIGNGGKDQLTSSYGNEAEDDDGSDRATRERR